MVAPVAEHTNIAVREVPFTPDSGTLAIRCGLLIDGVATLAQIDALLVIRDGRIKSVKAEASRSDAAAALVPVLDLSAYTCLPGLIDMHTHLTDRPEDTADLRVYFTRTLEATLQQSHENAAATVLAGFTSVRNVGTYVAGTDVLLRDAINRGEVLGPRMQVSGPYLTIPHGGGDLFVPDYQEPGDNSRFHFGVAQGAQQFHDRAEVLLASGSDLLKVIASGAVLAYGGVPGAPEMSREELDAVVKVAHAAGKKVAAHAHGAESIRMAMEAGADTIEHASYLDDAGIALALKRGNVALAMDVYNGDYIDTEGRRANWPEEFLRKNVETTEIQCTHRVRHRRGCLSPWPERAPVSHHGQAWHDADAGHPVRDLGGRTIHGTRGQYRHPRSRQVRRPHRGARQSAGRHQLAAEGRRGDQGRPAPQAARATLNKASGADAAAWSP
jgi:imidazolonepropionase-like amidohydrolase